MDNKIEKTVNKSIHAGHRKRVREKILSQSFEYMHDHEMLEYMLFSCIPQGDTNPLAHRLIDKFGSFNKVLEASPYELMQVGGVGEVTAINIASYFAVMKRYLIRLRDAKTVYDDTEQIVRYMQGLCLGNKYECAYALYLDKSKHLVYTERISEGTIDATGFYVDKIVESAILHKAYYVVIGHNHTSGNVAPSPADVYNTRLLQEALLSMRKYLLDSVIVDHLSGFSFLDSGIISNNRIINPYEKGCDIRIEEHIKKF